MLTSPAVLCILLMNATDGFAFYVIFNCGAIYLSKILGFGIQYVRLIFITYCQPSNISSTKFQNLNVYHLVLQLYLPNPLKPGVKSRMKMYLEQRRQAMLQLQLNDQ